MDDANHQADSIVAIALRHCKDEPAFVTPIPRLTLFHTRTTTEPVPAFYQPSFCAILQGRKAVRLGDRELGYGAGEYLVAGFDVPVIGTVTEASAAKPYLCLQLTFDRDLLLEVAETSASMTAPSPLVSLSIADTGMDLVSVMEKLVSLLDEPKGAAYLSTLYEREILFRLLSGPHGGQLRRFAYRDTSGAPVERAIEHIGGTFREPFRLDRLVEIARRSQSALYRDFKSATGLTPLQYRTRLRLQEVRRLMLTDNLSASEAGYAVGYASPSQLTRDYRRLYGYPPVADISRIRAFGSS